MKLYFSPGACSLSDRIALYEADLAFDSEMVDLETKRTESGDDYLRINPKGDVPTLVLDTGETLTENVAVLDWVAQQDSKLRPLTPMGRTRLLEALTYISAELHTTFEPFFTDASDNVKKTASETIVKRLEYLADTIAGDFLLGERVSVADFYLLVMLLWAGKNGLQVPAKLVSLRDRLTARAAVRRAMEHEQLV